MQHTAKRVTIWAGIVAFILLMPLVAMQFTSEVNWSLADFVVMGALLLGAGLAIEFVTKKFNNSLLKVAAIAAVVLVFLLTWAELAVGIFGTPWAGS